MSDNIIITEYVEETKVAQLLLQPQSVLDHEGYSKRPGPEGVVVTFDEAPQHDHHAPSAQGMPEIQILEIGEDIGDITEFFEKEDEDEEEDDELMDSDQEAFSNPGRNGLPGATNYVDDDDDDDDDLKEAIKDWTNDRDPNAFMEYILDAYPGKIPQHDGTSISMCEKVIQFLSKLNAEISEALRGDRDDCLDIGSLERMRVNMIKDNAVMKRHLKKLQRKHRESIAGLNISEDGFVKEATTPRIQLVMTPFERAVTGILINATVSAGKPFEEVYDFLDKKYSFTDREHLAILQLAMDMGQPIFKDRGTIGMLNKGEAHDGIDFIKNYFA
jgi:hypothetical protein